MSGARMILHSQAKIEGQIHDLMTLELIFHRFILAEVNTHCGIAKNSASSRAVPVHKSLKRIRENPAYPTAWLRERKGMQGGDPVSEAELIECNRIWSELIDFTADKVDMLREIGIHKQTANRPLEPYSWHVEIATGTREGWDHVLSLRDSPLAQPEFQDLAKIIRYTIDNSTPWQILEYGQYHLPLVQMVDYDEIMPKLGLQVAKRISAARCARVSYLTHDGKIDWEADLRRANLLAFPEEGAIHASPFEHVCHPVGVDVRSRLCPFGTYRQEVEMGLF